MTIDTGSPAVAPPGDAVSTTIGTNYEAIIREAVLEAMRAPDLIRSAPPLSAADRAALIGQLHELRALLQRLLVAVTDA